MVLIYLRKEWVNRKNRVCMIGVIVLVFLLLFKRKGWDLLGYDLLGDYWIWYE